LGNFTVRIGNKDVRWVTPDNSMLLSSMRHILDRKAFAKNIRNLRKEAKVAIDVGACVGAFSWLFHYTWPEAKIYALEPVRESYICLEQNLANIPQIKPLRIGASDHRGTMTIAMPTLEQKTFQNRGTGDNMGIMSVYGESELYRQEIEVHTLDSLFSYADVIKIDAEGHDYQVLLGAEGLLKDSRPFLIVEIVPFNFVLSGNTLKDLLLLLAKHNYHIVMAALGNVFCVPAEKLTKRALETKVEFELVDNTHYTVTWRKP